MVDFVVQPLRQASVSTAGATPLPVRFLAVRLARAAGSFLSLGDGVISGTVKRKDTPANVALKRRVRLYRERDGVLVRETWSDPVTGAYTFVGLPRSERYTALAYDYEHDFRAIAADNLVPEVKA